METITIIVLSIIIVVLIIILIVNKSSTSTRLKNGGIFPFNTVVVLKNNTGSMLDNVEITDSKGNTFIVQEGKWTAGSSIYLDWSVYSNYDHLDIYGVVLSGEEITKEVTIQMVNVDNLIVFQYLFGTDRNSIGFDTVSKNTSNTIIKPIAIYENPVYKVNVTTLQNGEEFPDKMILYNNTTSQIVQNPSDDSGDDPLVDQLTITSLSIIDSENNTYVDLDTSGSLSSKHNSDSNLLSKQLQITFVNPIDPGQYVQIYMEDSKNNSYTITLYNNKGKVVITYSSNMDPSAISIMKLANQLKYPLPCSSKPLRHKSNQFSASFLSNTIWPNGTIFKIGFMGGEEWKRAWIAKIIKERLEPFVNLTFNFVLNNVVLDKTYQIRIEFDPKAGCNSEMGSNALTTPEKNRTMNFQWMDIPFNTTFIYNNNSYTTPASGYEEGNIASRIESNADRLAQYNNTNGWGSTILHEFCHALGMQHEHTTPFNFPVNYNNKNVILYYSGPPNYWDENATKENVLNKDPVNTTNGSDFDKFSIMKYSIEIRGKNPKYKDIPETDPRVNSISDYYLSLVDNKGNELNAIKEWCGNYSYVLSDCDKFYLAKMYPGKTLPGNITCSLDDHPRDLSGNNINIVKNG